MSTSVARKLYRFNRTLVSTSIDSTRAVVHAVGDGVASTVGVLRDSGAIVIGQGRSAVDRTVSQALIGASEVRGQARAQGDRASAQIDDVVERTARRATAAVDDSPSSGTPYEQWTKSELYARAQDLDVEGRSTMSKRELIAALRAR